MRTTLAMAVPVAVILFAAALNMVPASTGSEEADEANRYWIDEADLSSVEIGWGSPGANRSVDGNPLRIAGREFERGLGTHADSSVRFRLHGKARRFHAFVGVDDEVGSSPASVEFQIYGDGRLLWKSGVLRAGEPAKEVVRNMKGLDIVTLVVTGADDGINFDHADWADAYFEYEGRAPEVLAAPRREPYILTPPPPATPRINGARVFGVRPGSPFLFTIPATGERPMAFAARNLPPGLKVDAQTGRITGRTEAAGEHRATLVAENAKGRDERELRIVVGDRIALTPPMGWNSWNCWAGAVSQEKVLSSARAMVETGLVNHGWSYINIDDTWQADERGGPHNAILGNEKFPDVAGLCEEVHAMGLKIGIYSTPWITSYAGYIGGSSNDPDGAWSRAEWGNQGSGRPGWRHGEHSFATNDANQWAEWGFDYLKYDWNPNDVPHVREMSEALKATGRDIVYSLSNSAPFDHAGDWAELSNCWRTTGDIVDTWGSMSGIGFSQDRWRPYGGPGRWNDPDMLVVGKVGWGPNLHPSRLTPDEQYTHISLWCLLSAPLLLGNDLADMDEFTLGLLTNDEVLEVNQDPVGDQASRVVVRGETEVWAKAMEDGSKAVGLFNRSPMDAEVVLEWSDLALMGRQRVRDLWRQEDLGRFKDRFESTVPAHGVTLVRIWPD